jgi:plasmid replication initiation protein
MNIKKITPNNMLYKSNSLINSLYDLSLQEQRIVLILISMVNPREDQDFRSYEMSVDMFMKIVGVEGKAYHKELDLITDKLMKRSFRIDDPDGGWLKINWLSSCRYKKGEGSIELEISTKLRPYLLDLKSHYTSYRLKNILPLRSGYSIRIYELLKQYETIGERYLTLEEMRTLMEISDKEYPLYANFKKKVILKAQKELLEKTDLCFDFKEKKKVRKIIGIYFFIKRNEQKEDKTIDMVMAEDSAVPASDAIKSIANIELYQRLQKLGFTSDQAKVLMSKYDELRLVANLDYAEYKTQQGNIENIPAYTMTIIKNDVRQQTSLFDKAMEQQHTAKIEAGMVIEIDGVLHTVEDGYIRTEKGVIPSGEITTNIKSGTWKVIDGNTL